MLALLAELGAHSDVVREAQELVELDLKGMLRWVGTKTDPAPAFVEFRRRAESGSTSRPSLGDSASRATSRS